jgi:hypothetical protein
MGYANLGYWNVSNQMIGVCHNQLADQGIMKLKAIAFSFFYRF